MPACTDIADYKWLTGGEACRLLTELAEIAAPLHTVVGRLRGQLSPERTHLLVEQVELRRRAAAKFSRPQQMFFTRVGLEQATDEWVAAYKASRFASLRGGASTSSQRAGASSPPAIADLCCGIGGDLIALSKIGACTGVDRDPIAAHFAAVNSNATTHEDDVTKFNLSDAAAWHIDPDRRPEGRRTTSLEISEPGVADLQRMLERVPYAAVKLAPATVVPEVWASDCELEWISRRRECKQLVAWHGALANHPGQRRATVVADASFDEPRRSVVGRPNQPVPVVERADRYVFDVDPAVSAARLKGALAAEYELSALSHGPTYLTGPSPIVDAALACFEVADVLPLQTRELADYLRERGIGTLEIKKRGVEIEPDKLRRQLKLRGDNCATLLITPVGGRPTTIVAQRVSATPTRPR